MIEAVTMDMVFDELKSLKKEVTFIKKHMVDVDTVLTDDDFESLNEAEKDLKAGKTKRLN